MQLDGILGGIASLEVRAFAFCYRYRFIYCHHVLGFKFNGDNKLLISEYLVN